MPVGRDVGVNSVGVKRRKKFSPAVPSTPTQGHFVLSPLSLTSRLNGRHLRSHGKTGDCEKSKFWRAFLIFVYFRFLYFGDVFTKTIIPLALVG